MSELNNFAPDEFDAWLHQQAGDAVATDDEKLANGVSRVIREDKPEVKAQQLLEVANLCMAMADRLLGCQVPVATCLTLTRH